MCPIQTAVHGKLHVTQSSRSEKRFVCFFRSLIFPKPAEIISKAAHFRASSFGRDLRDS